MTPAELASLPDWPALMEPEVAIAYLGGKKFIFFALVEHGWLEPFTVGHRYLTFRRVDIDAAMAIGKQSTLNVRPSPGIDTVGKAMKKAKAGKGRPAAA